MRGEKNDSEKKYNDKEYKSNRGKSKFLPGIVMAIIICMIIAMLAGCVEEPKKPEPVETKLDQPHLTHQNSILLNFACSDCHNTDPDGEIILRDSDLYFVGELDTEDFRVDVNREDNCIRCHGVFPTNATSATSIMTEAYKDMDCTSSSCHSDFADRMSGATFVNLDIITADDCLTCHGGDNAFYDTPPTYP